MSLSHHAVNVLNQLNSLFDQLSHQNYTEKLPVLGNSSIGQHYRHIIEFYECLAEGCQCGWLSYDNRKRNLMLEQDMSFTKDFIKDIISEMKKINENNPLTLKATLGSEGKILTTLIESTVQRELVYVIEHSIHHMAMIKIGLAHKFPEIVLPHNFGVADSTTRHKNTVCAQ